MEITQEQLKSILNYDPETGLFTWIVDKAMCRKAGSRAGWKSDEGYMCVEIDNHGYKLHRLAWLYMKGYMPEGQIDHINGNKSDNAIINLRDVDASENLKNKRIYANNKSGYNGVYWNRRRNKWEACIRVNRKLYALGLFDDVLDAAECRRLADIKFGFHENHGNTVCLN